MQSFVIRPSTALALSLSLAACKHEEPVNLQVDATPTAQHALAPVSAYAPARWRLANPVELGNVVLWVSHILVRHRDVRNADPAFSMADWHSESPGGDRSRAEALARARDLREQVAKEPARFAEVAMRHSEDVATRSLGGSLGGIQATQLELWSNVLDALAATPPGQVSQVIETAYGFHILQRRPPPPEDTVSGAHIVIAHEEAGWISVLERGETPPRSRAEASALATELYEKARAKPEEFSKLVEEYSEHRDALRSGDMGAWSTREPTYYPREVEILAQLRVGEVAPPLDSPVGFQIIRRTPNRPRERYAMAPIRLYFKSLFSAPEPESRGLILAKATELSRQVRRAPSRFAELQREHCCTYVEDWLDGRGSPALTNELSELKVGEIAREPVRSEFSYVIAKRVAAPTPVSIPTRYELPEPDAPNIRAFVGPREDRFLKEQAQRLGEEVVASLPMPAPIAKQVVELHGGPGRFEGLSTTQLRIQAFDSLLEEMKAVLDPEKYSRYLELVNTHFERVLLERH
jgi:parvulin-like peptidyl-prolyl isomerase